MSRKNPKAGQGKCPTCGAAVWFRASPTTERLTFSCDSCDSSGYADGGGVAAAKWAATIDKPAASPVAAPAAPAPAPKKAANLFGFGAS